MPLQIGARLGSYEVTGTLGAGGMGEVYRARDGRLNRDVALKVLPDAFASDPERLARFEREAQLLASLNHPHIAGIYGLEEGPLRGPSETGLSVRALVLELVEGETLADRLPRGPIPLDEALSIAKQIALALETAHEQGIVHRDLKPANIKVTPGGTVKVLDFGLAKLVERGGSGPRTPVDLPPSMSPTMASPAMMTGVGMILGTAAYMSPEQAKGREADKRSDVWAFGCVLFEMLSGKRPFEGEDVSDMLAAVLRAEPDWAALPPATPPAVLRLIRRCLRRDPHQRIRDIGDARLELEELASEPALTTATAGDRGARPHSRWVRLLPWAVALVAVVASVFLFFQSRAGSSSDDSVRRIEVSTPAGVELYTLTGGVGVSRDGSRIAFIGIVGPSRRVYVRPIDRFEAEPLRGTEAASWCCTFSDDGSSLAFVTTDGSLKKVSLADGLVTTIAASADRQGADWAADGSIVFVRSGALWTTASSGGEPKPLLMAGSGKDERRLAWPVVLPGAHAVLFASSEGWEDSWQIESFAPATGERHVVVPRGTLPLYAPTGHLIFYRDGELLAAPFDAGTQRVTGAAVRILESVPATVAGVPLADVSATGALVYAPTIASARLVWVFREGAEQALADTPRIYANPRLDPKGRWVLVSAGDLWVHDLARASFSRVTLGNIPVGGGFPVLTPDGTRVVFRTSTGLSWQAIDGGSRAETIEGTGRDDYPGSVAPDGEKRRSSGCHPGRQGISTRPHFAAVPRFGPWSRRPGTTAAPGCLRMAAGSSTHRMSRGGMKCISARIPSRDDA
jgi:serine/threonine-protein kinase